MRPRFIYPLVAAAILSAAIPAHAIDVLQLYVENGVYDASTQTWVTAVPDFDLWVIGDVTKKGTIFDVKLVASFFGTGGSITITPKTTSLIVDPSTPAAPTFLTSGVGNHPVLPPHGIFNDPELDHWNEYALGDFTLLDSPIADFDGSLPFPTLFPDQGQVNVYAVHVEDWNIVHFDAYGFTVDDHQNRQDWFVPASHDAEFTIDVPTPVQAKDWGGIKALFR